MHGSVVTATRRPRVRIRSLGASHSPLARVQKFLVELEFVQCLANPLYIDWLARQGYLLDGKFVRYLDYLQYWKQPQYAKFLVYPHCLRFLDLLQHEEIRKQFTEDRNFALQLHDQQFYHWLYRRRHTNHASQPAAPH